VKPDDTAVCVVVAARGYPDAYPKRRRHPLPRARRPRPATTISQRRHAETPPAS